MTKSDPRCVVGALVHAKAVHVTSSIECHRRYGSLAKTKLVNGVVTKVETVPSSTNNCSVTLITADYSLGGGSTKAYVMNSRNVKAGHVAAVANEDNGLGTESGIQNSTTATTTNETPQLLWSPIPSKYLCNRLRTTLLTRLHLMKRLSLML